MSKRTIVTIAYLAAMFVAVSIVWQFRAPTEDGGLMMIGLGAAWLLALPWSLLTIFVLWWFLHDYASPVFLYFFLAAAIVNAVLLNLTRIYNVRDPK